MSRQAFHGIIVRITIALMWGVYAGSGVTGALRVGLTGTPGTGKTTEMLEIGYLTVLELLP